MIFRSNTNYYISKKTDEEIKAHTTQLFSDVIFKTKLCNLVAGMKIIATLLRYKDDNLDQDEKYLKIMSVCYPYLLKKIFDNKMQKVGDFFGTTYGFDKETGSYYHPLQEVNNFADSYLMNHMLKLSNNGFILEPILQLD